jgi:hypothetical protein
MEGLLAILFVKRPALRIPGIALGSMASFAFQELNHSPCIAGVVAIAARCDGRWIGRRMGIARCPYVQCMVKSHDTAMSATIEHNRV